MLTLSVVKTAFFFQLGLAGLMLLAFAMNQRKWLIGRRLVRHRRTASSAARHLRGNTQMLARIGNWLVRDIPADHRHAVGQRLRKWGGAFQSSDASFGWLRLGAAPVSALLTYGLTFAVQQRPPSPIALAIAGIIGVLVAFVGARRFAADAVERNHEAVTRKMPYALELILIFLDAGLSLTLAFERVADALEERQPALHDELRLTLADLRVLGSQDLAFKNMAERINTPNMHSIVNILRQSIQYGSPISEAMKNAITLMRRTEIVLLEEQANKLPSKITLVTLLFIFPAFIIILAGPAMIGLTSAMTRF